MQNFKLQHQNSFDTCSLYKHKILSLKIEKLKLIHKYELVLMNKLVQFFEFNSFKRIII